MNRTKIDKAKTGAARYFALHEQGLRNGSFFRLRGLGYCAQYTNGDFYGERRPTS